MGVGKCPGARVCTSPRIELIKCPHCGGRVEIWSDEPEGTCDRCGLSVSRTALQSCVDSCRYAKECLGEEKYREYMRTKALMHKEPEG